MAGVDIYEGDIVSLEDSVPTEITLEKGLWV
jgi:hypothetical protein